MIRTLSELAALGRPLQKLFFRQLTLHGDTAALRQTLGAESHLVIVLNHGPMLAPAAALLGIQEVLCRHGGGHRRVLGVTWKHFYKLPLLKHVFTYVTQINRGLGVEELVARLKDGRFHDILIMPEGENCNFGDGETVQPFLSPRFVEIALRTGAPILIATHRGGRYWSRYLPGVGRYLARVPRLPERVTRLAAEAGGVNLPRLRGRALADYPWSVELYRPTLTLGAFDAADDQEKSALLTAEAEQVRARMQAALSRLPDPVSAR